MKRTIKSKEIIRDIRSGMSKDALKEKYGLTETSFNHIINKLKSSGLIETSQIPLKGDNPIEVGQEPFACLACGWKADSPFEECPKCGIVIAKARHIAEARSGALPNAPTYGDDMTKIRSGTPEQKRAPGMFRGAIQGLRFKKTIIGIIVVIVIVGLGTVIEKLLVQRGIDALSSAADTLDETLSVKNPDELALAISRMEVFLDHCSSVMAARSQPFQNKEWAYDVGVSKIAAFGELLHREAGEPLDQPETKMIHGVIPDTILDYLLQRLNDGALSIPNRNDRSKMEMYLISQGQFPKKIRQPHSFSPPEPHF